MSSLTIAIIVVFCLGYALIATESLTKINKAAIALLMFVACWTLYMCSPDYFVGLMHPDFKGAGEKLHLISKVFAGLVFAGIIFVGISAPIYAVLFGIFASYALFGIVNHTLTILGGSK